MFFFLRTEYSSSTHGGMAFGVSSSSSICSRRNGLKYIETTSGSRTDNVNKIPHCAHLWSL